MFARPGLLGSPGLAFPQTDFPLEIDGEIVTALERRARDVPEIGAVKSVDVAGRLVGLRGVERAIAIGPHLAAVAADDHGEIALGLGVVVRSQRLPALGALAVAGRCVARSVAIERVE